MHLNFEMRKATLPILTTGGLQMKRSIMKLSYGSLDAHTSVLEDLVGPFGTKSPGGFDAAVRTETMQN